MSVFAFLFLTKVGFEQIMIKVIVIVYFFNEFPSNKDFQSVYQNFLALIFLLPFYFAVNILRSSMEMA